VGCFRLWDAAVAIPNRARLGCAKPVYIMWKRRTVLL